MTENKFINEEIMYLSDDWKNNSGQKSAVFSFAENLIDFLIILPVLILILRITKASTPVYYTSALIPVSLSFLTINRLKSKKLGIYILFLLIITAATFTLSIIFNNYITSAYSIVAALISYTKLKNSMLLHGRSISDKPNVPIHAYRSWTTVIGCSFIFYIVYMLALYNGYKDLIVFCFADFAIIFAAMLLYLQKSGSSCFSHWNKIAKTGNGGDNDVKAGGKMFALWVFTITAFISLIDFLIATLCGISRIDTSILAFITRPFHIKVPVNIKTAANQKQIINTQQNLDLQHSFKYAKPKGTSFSFIGNLLHFFILAVIGIAGVITIILIYNASKAVHQKLKLKINTERHSLISVNYTVENAKKAVKRIGRSFNIFSHLSNRMKIRKLFLVHVKKQNNIIVKNSDTPIEIGGKIVRHSGNDLIKAAKYYEKARYSINECDDTDLKNMKDALK